jgi:drug/metabolite transporter (DMT)-like permease
VLAACWLLRGAAIAILGRARRRGAGGWSWGYLLALGAAFIWASYSLLTSGCGLSHRRHRPVRAGVGPAVAAVPCAAGARVPRCQARDWLLLAVMGLGPLGAAFFLWDRALKLGDARHIGILSYITPLASTALLMVVSGRAFSWSIGLAAVMIIGAAVLGTRAR